MTYFTIITGVATLLSLLLQLSGLLPLNYKRYIPLATIFLFGLTAGLLLGMTSSVTITFSQPMRLLELLGVFLIGGTGLLIAFLTIVSVWSNEPTRRETAKEAAASLAFGFFMLLMLGGGLFFLGR